MERDNYSESEVDGNSKYIYVDIQVAQYAKYWHN